MYFFQYYMVLELKSRTILRPLISLHSSINITGMSQRSNVCLILTDLDS